MMMLIKSTMKSDYHDNYNYEVNDCVDLILLTGLVLGSGLPDVNKKI